MALNRQLRTLFCTTTLLKVILAFTVVVLSSLASLTFASETNKKQDLYQILGVSRTATTREIKQAYRRKALDTHPDKNKDLPPEDAAEAFRQVVHAFEILSDDASRKLYDRTGSADQTQQAQQRQQAQWTNQGTQWTFRWSSGSWHHQQRPKLKDRFDVKEAQSRILHIVSLEQLETVIVNEDDETLERNLVICFCPVPLEKHVMDEMVYPWPFAAMSLQGIWWEDLLQTTMVRFHRSNDSTKFFGIPPGDQMDEPIFIFGKRGNKFNDPETWSRRLQTRNREVFDPWMWRQLQVEIEFVNEHDHPVEVFWINDRRGTAKMTIPSGHSQTHTTMLAHEWWVRDARTDARPDSPGRYNLLDTTILKKWKIVSDKKYRYKVPLRKCFDLSGHCAYWQLTKQCEQNPNFMAEVCPLSCNLCESDYREEDDEEEEGTTQQPKETNQSSDNQEEQASSDKDEL
ncbi:chaperone protein DnaJ [Nitzschia inconspicua]|uniref:Chaperone protein DnaJ n=1 Tax=Nitzschia inconspicua TaxID=303405 RepID=A0A9K3PPF1_9STRA|nr:chaperone protein DnaJ [Nitzschia inconspicua]